MTERTWECISCGYTVSDGCWSNYCGAYVCPRCDQHHASPFQALERCYCGWRQGGWGAYEPLEDDDPSYAADDLWPW